MAAAAALFIVACSDGDDPIDGDAGDVGVDTGTGGGDSSLDGSGDGGPGDGGPGDGGDGGDGGDTGPPPCTADADCDDGYSCTTDTCDTASGSCVFTPDGVSCGDGTFCNGIEQCNPSAAGADAVTGCAPGTPPDCDDGLSCTTDTCDETSASCINTPDDTSCDDGAFCTGTETCAPTAAGADATTGCLPGTTPTCDDGFSCTTDSCDTTTDACVNTTVDSACDDGLFCTGTETCSPTTSGADATTGCVAGSPVVCDDTFSCTDDTCDDVSDSCVSTPIDTVCDNSMFCDGVEVCDPSASGADARGCASGPAVTCADDGFTCTVESCDEASDACTTTYDHASCGSGLVCTAMGTGSSGCEPGATCTADADCDDSNVCNGIETCSGGLCQPGTALDCSDSIACTDDTCDPTAGCINTANDANCDNGVVCDGIEICDPSLNCLSGTPLNCNDGISCTLDSCSETVGGCVNTVDDGLCDDGVFCNGAELCSPTMDCRPGTPPSCDDGLACTDDTCDTTMDACVSTGVDSRCDDTAYCNGVESCVVGVGCQSGTPVNCNDGISCSVDSCNETSDMCEYVYDSTMCSSGEVCTTSGCTPGTSCTGPTASVCDDGLVCNGTETCSSSTSVPGVCEGGTPLDCDDGNACTVDGCSESVGGCTHTPQDVDGDGYGDASCGGMDCDDSDPAINPGATDVCDGVDNDCDGLIDGGLVSLGGACTSSSQCCSGSCASGTCVLPPGSCQGILDTCAGPEDCCTGLCAGSVDGTLRCQVPGGCAIGGDPCVVAADCCSTGCVGGFCDDTVTCTDTGGSCTTDVECCTHNCVSGFCEVAGSGCSVDGETCSSNGNCCSGFCFDPDGTGVGRCSDHDTCRGEGQICVTGGDCCHGGCDLTEHPDMSVGRCQFLTSCATAGESCTSVRGCCSALCVDAGSGVGICEFLPGCRPFGEICSSNGDCCSDECGPPEGAAGVRRCVNPPGCVHSGEICGQGGSNNCCVTKSDGCTPTGLGVSRCNDQLMCIPLGGECDFTEQCCLDPATGEHYLCAPDPTTGVPVCSDMCVPTGGSCLSNADCCEGTCLDGICDDTDLGCIPAGGTGCVLDSDCCSGTCLGGVCGTSGD